MDEMSADPVALARLAGAFLTASQRLSDALTTAQARVSPPATVYGDTTGAARLHTANELAVEKAGLAAGRLIEVLEGDVDRLYQLVSVYEQADRQARTPMRTGGPQP